MSLQLLRTFRCEIITPLGSDVEPDVYWMYATDSGEVSGTLQASGSLRSSVFKTSMPASEAAESDTNSELPPRSVVKTTVAPASLATVRQRLRCELRRGGFSGTAMVPEYKQPNRAKRNS